MRDTSVSAASMIMRPKYALFAFIGDIANQLYELSLMRPRRVTRASGLAVPAE
jgi:hypothetical protein